MFAVLLGKLSFLPFSGRGQSACSRGGVPMMEQNMMLKWLTLSNPACQSGFQNTVTQLAQERRRTI